MNQARNTFLENACLRAVIEALSILGRNGFWTEHRRILYKMHGHCGQDVHFSSSEVTNLTSDRQGMDMNSVSGRKCHSSWPYIIYYFGSGVYPSWACLVKYNDSFIHVFVHTFIICHSVCPFARSFVCSFLRSSIRSLLRSFVRSFVRLLIRDRSKLIH